MGQSLGSEERQLKRKLKPRSIKPLPLDNIPSLLPPPKRIFKQLEPQKATSKPFKPLKRHLLRLSESDLKRQVIKRQQAVIWDLPAEISFLDDQTLRQFARATSSNKDMQQLRLKLENEKSNVNFSVKGLSYMSYHLKNLASLRSLNFNVTTGHKITNMALDDLSKGLKRLVFLQDLHLTFSDPYKLNELDLDQLSQALKRLRNLQNLKITFLWHNEVAQKGMRFLLRGLERLIYLKRLNLSFFFTEHSPKEMFNLARGFQRLQCLQSLELCLMAPTSGNLGAFEAKNLGEALRNLTSLKNLSFLFSGLIQVNDLGMKDLMKGFEKLILLEKIGLFFYGCPHTNGTCPQLTDASLQCIEETFRKLSVLETARLGFQKCDQVTLKGVNQLRGNLKGLSSVRTVSIFSAHTKIVLTKK